MFESSVVESKVQVIAARRVATLPVSLVTHTAIILGITFGMVWNVRFPVATPAIADIYTPLVSPRIPPPPARRAAARPEEAARSIPSATVAPLAVPETVPVRLSPAAGEGTEDGDGVEHGGSADGVVGGVDDGTPGSLTESGSPVDRSSGPIVVGGAVKSPVLIHRVAPVYPPLARAVRKQGSVDLRCVIDREGNVRDAVVLRSDSDLFSKAALEAVRRWRYRPATLGGAAVDVFFELHVDFVLR